MFAKGTEAATRRWLIGSTLIFGPVFYRLTERKETQVQKPIVVIEKPTAAATPLVSKPLQLVTEKPTETIPHVKYVLIGGGTASYSAMEALKMSDPNAQILIIGKEIQVPYVRPPLSKELWFSPVSETKYKDWQGVERSVFYLPEDAYKVVKPSQINETAQVQIILGYQVEKLQLDKKQVVLENGQRISYDKVLIATGGTPKVPEFAKNALSDRVVLFRDLKDYQKLVNWTNSDAVEKIAVVGGGFLGSELAVALAQKSKKIVQIFPENGNIANVFPKYLSEWTSSELSSLGIKVVPNTSISAIDTSSDKVKLSLSQGGQIEADRVVLAAGITPNTDFCAKSGLEIDSFNGGVLVNAELEARSGVYAAGDVCSYHDIALGRRRVEHHDHAIMSGKQAGENMAGSSMPYTHQSMFWSDLGPKVAFEAVGLVDSKLQTVSVWSRDHAKGSVLYLLNSKVVGILLWNLPGKLQRARQVLLDEKTSDYKELATSFLQ